MAFLLCYIGDNQCCNINDVSYLDVPMNYSRLIKKMIKNVDIKFSAHDVKIVFVENHGLLSGIYIVPYSDNQPFKLC
jgi:hypothetical protein